MREQERPTQRGIEAKPRAAGKFGGEFAICPFCRTKNAITYYASSGLWHYSQRCRHLQGVASGGGTAVVFNFEGLPSEEEDGLDGFESVVLGSGVRDWEVVTAVEPGAMREGELFPDAVVTLEIPVFKLDDLWEWLMATEGIT